jgi:DNA (cytosine-5)-methyltransferase 1
VSKKNALGMAHGFNCETQGTLFFYIEKILQAKRPSAFLLENVKNLQSHDKGRTFDVIVRTLRDKLGYQIHYKVIDAKAFTPQHRERIFIVGFREPTAFSWDRVDLEDKSRRVGTKMADILHPEDGSESPEADYTVGAAAAVNRKYILTPKLWAYLKAYAAKHQAKGNGFGYGLVGSDDTCRTLSARYYKDGSEILISRGARARPRRLTPRECARLMGFPDSFKIPVSDTQAYRQFGNSVVVPVVEAIAHAMAPHIVTLRRQAAEDQIALVV